MKMHSALFITISLLISGCNAGPNRTNIELMQDMMDQVNVKAQDYDTDRKDMRANMVPPENTVPRGFSPYKYSNKPLDAEAQLVNPIAGDFTPAVLERGKAKFDIYCAVCHGGAGAGDGPVAAKMILKPPALVSDKVKAFKDGRIFHIITDGQGLMGSYASQLNHESDRWAIVNYVRTLQRKAN